MNKQILKAGGAALTLALLTAGATAVQSRSSVEGTIKQAEGDAANAQKSLGKHNAADAVRFAEHAVALRPQDATYRALLGKSYLAAGRFESAKQAFADALSLDAGQPGAALNYALATTATGDFAGAQQILTANANSIAPADRGLAFALAGNPAAGVDILTAAARQPDVNAKTRQNLALALALAGRWPEARQMALADLSPTDADARIVQWAQFARPAAASDQVAALLGVVPVADQGVPAQLALVASPAQVAEAAPAPAPVPVQAPIVAAQDWKPDLAAGDKLLAIADAMPVPIPAAAPAPLAVAAAAPQPAVSTVVFGDRRAVVQALPASRPARVIAPVKVAAPASAAAPIKTVTPARVAAVAKSAPAGFATAPAAKGNFYVQLGAFNGAAMAKWGWNHVRARQSVLAGKTPSTMPIGKGLIRVSVGGFARNDANALCRSIRANRGVCFVRAGAGDRVASWAGKSIQLASR